MAAWLEAPLSAIARPLRWLAGSTFTIYLFHMPPSRFLAAVTERRKQPWVRLFTAAFAPFHRLAQAAPAGGTNHLRPVAPPPGHAAAG